MLSRVCLATLSSCKKGNEPCIGCKGSIAVDNGDKKAIDTLNRHDFKKNSYNAVDWIIDNKYRQWAVIGGSASYKLRNMLKLAVTSQSKALKRSYERLDGKSLVIYHIEGRKTFFKGKWAYISVINPKQANYSFVSEFINYVGRKTKTGYYEPVSKSVEAYLSSTGKKGSKISLEEFLSIAEAKLSDLEDELSSAEAKLNSMAPYRKIAIEMGVFSEMADCGSEYRRLERVFSSFKKSGYNSIHDKVLQLREAVISQSELVEDLQERVRLRNESDDFITGGVSEKSSFEDYEAFDYSKQLI